MNTTDQEPLSLQLRQSTAAAHTDAEGSDFIKKLFSGTCTEQEYYLYLWSLEAMYTALENELEKNKNNDQEGSTKHTDDEEQIDIVGYFLHFINPMAISKYIIITNEA